MIGDTISVHLPKPWKKYADKLVSREVRRPLLLVGSFLAFGVASFLAFDDVNGRNRKLEIELATVQGQLKAANSSLADKRNRAAIKAKLLHLYAEGAPLEGGGGLSKNATPEEVKAYIAKVAAWRDSTGTWIEKNLGKGAASRFEDTSIQYQRGASPHPYAANPDHDWYMNYTGWLRQNLGKLIETDAWDRP